MLNSLLITIFYSNLCIKVHDIHVKYTTEVRMIENVKVLHVFINKARDVLLLDKDDFNTVEKGNEACRSFIGNSPTVCQCDHMQNV